MWNKIRLSDVEVVQLERVAQKALNPRYQKRAQALLELGKGIAGPKVARKYGICDQTLYNWMTNFRDRNGAQEWLSLKPKTGNGDRWPEKATPIFLRLLNGSPSDYGYPAKTWSTRLLKRHLKEEGFIVGHKMVRESMHRLGYRYDQAKAMYVSNKPVEQPPVVQNTALEAVVEAPGAALVVQQPGLLTSVCVGVFPTVECPGVVVIDACQGVVACASHEEPAAKPEHAPRRRGRPAKQSAPSHARKDANASRRVSEEEVKHLRCLAQYAPVPEYRQRAAMLLAMAPGDLDEIVLRNSH